MNVSHRKWMFLICQTNTLKTTLSIRLPGSPKYANAILWDPYKLLQWWAEFAVQNQNVKIVVIFVLCKALLLPNVHNETD